MHERMTNANQYQKSNSMDWSSDILQYYILLLSFYYRYFRTEFSNSFAMDRKCQHQTRTMFTFQCGCEQWHVTTHHISTARHRTSTSSSFFVPRKASIRIQSISRFMVKVFFCGINCLIGWLVDVIGNIGLGNAYYISLYVP